MRLDVRTILVLLHPDRRQVLLLRRSPDKDLFPNLLTGIGGKVELGEGEGEDLEGSLWREVNEETRIPRDLVGDCRLRLSTLLSRGGEQVVLLWFIGTLKQVPADLACNEGSLEFFDRLDLPLVHMVPTAREAVRFITSLPDDDMGVYNGIYRGPDLELLTSRLARASQT